MLIMEKNLMYTEEEPVAETVVTVIFSDLKQFVADVSSDTLRLMFGSYL